MGTISIICKFKRNSNHCSKPDLSETDKAMPTKRNIIAMYMFINFASIFFFNQINFCIVHINSRSETIPKACHE